MTTIEDQREELIKILRGLEIVYARLIEYKKQKNSVFVIMKDNKIVHVKPEDMPSYH